MNIDLALTIALAVLWAAAGILVDALPGATDVRVLRRRAGVLLLVVAAAVAAVVALRGPVPLIVAAAVVVVVVGPRLLRVRRGARPFLGAPHVPMPPSLRAAAAHPLVALPIQVTALVAIVSATGVAAGAVLGIALTAAGLVAAAFVVRHGLRHSRLAEAAVGIRRPRSAVN